MPITLRTAIGGLPSHLGVWTRCPHILAHRGRRCKGGGTIPLVTFDEATSCFHDSMHILIDDPDGSTQEECLILIGSNAKSTVIVVIHLDVDEDKIRIISVRKASNKKRKNDDEV